MTALLTDNLPLLAGAPKGIKKLRELILELAVRGKLVPQDPSDEPASELLKRIAEEKARLVAEGKIKKHKVLTKIDDDEKSFELPAGWAWQRFADFALDVSTGPFGSLIHQSDYVDDGIPLVNPSHMIDGRIVADQSVSLSTEMAESLISYRLSAGDMVMARRGEVGRVALVTWAEDGWLCGTGSFVLRFTAEVSRAYVWALFRCNSVRTYLAGAAVGTTMVNLNHGILLKMPIAVPPLAEQHRIVAKVDELMALCDRLEAQQTDADSAHAQLVQALLNSLTQASDADDFAQSWQRLAEHFHTLFTTESSIDALKQTLLQLAVMGKLVPQDPSDEPASELLKRIAEEKIRLIAEGKIRKPKKLAALAEDEKGFELAAGWEWSRLGDHVLESGAGWSPSCESRPRSGNDWGVLKVSAVSWGTYRPEENKALPIHLDARPEHEVAENDFLVSRANTADLVARSVVVHTTPKRLMLSDKIVRLKLSKLCDRRYINLANSAQHARQYYAQIAGGTSSSMKNVSREQILSLPVALPPLAEQHRIVARVDQLMALCDQLKTRLTEARQLNEQLASTLVEHALAGGSSQHASTATDQKAARTLLAAEIAHRLYGAPTFGQRKFQKVIFLAEHAAKLEAINGNYLRNVAGPHDRQLMNQVEAELNKQQWYERIERETVGHAYRPLPQAGQHRQAYANTWSAADRASIEQVIELMRDWNTDRCEITATLYAAWNDFIIEGRPVTDEGIVAEVLNRWNDAKLRFSKAEWLAVLTEMKKQKLLIPTGFGKRTTGGALTLPGFE